MVPGVKQPRNQPALVELAPEIDNLPEYDACHATKLSTTDGGAGMELNKIGRQLTASGE